MNHSGSALDLRTDRLDLICGAPRILRAELASHAALARAARAEVPASWPPELYDAGAVRWMLEWLEAHPGEERWGFYYIALRVTNAPRSLIGAGGFKGAPAAAGVVEIGYSVVPEHRRRGYALEAVHAWLTFAFADARVRAVVAHTLTELQPSIGVLTRAGFRFVGPGDDPAEPAAVQYRLDRADWLRR